MVAARWALAVARTKQSHISKDVQKGMNGKAKGDLTNYSATKLFRYSPLPFFLIYYYSLALYPDPLVLVSSRTF